MKSDTCTQKHKQNTTIHTNTSQTQKMAHNHTLTGKKLLRGLKVSEKKERDRVRASSKRLHQGKHMSK